MKERLAVAKAEERGLGLTVYNTGTNAAGDRVAREQYTIGLPGTLFPSTRDSQITSLLLTVSFGLGAAHFHQNRNLRETAKSEVLKAKYGRRMLIGAVQAIGSIAVLAPWSIDSSRLSGINAGGSNSDFS
jgi:hypothetical protein